MSDLPHMPLFVDAYLADTTHLSTEEHGAYCLLLFAMWRRNGSVPNDDKDLARIVGLSTRKWSKTKERLRPLLVFEGDAITQKKLQKTFKKQREIVEKNRANGALGGRSRSKKNNDLAKANGSVSLNPNGTLQNHNQIDPPPPNGGSPPTEADQADDLFEDPKPARKRGTRLPSDWKIPSEYWEFARAEGMSLEEIDFAANQFKDYWTSKTGSASTKLDWLATWRSWVRKDIKQKAERKARTNDRQQQSVDRYEAFMAGARDVELDRRADPDADQPLPWPPADRRAISGNR